MKELRIDVKNKIATYNSRDGIIVCNNKDYYKIRFTFDAEWDEFPEKQARFIWNNKYLDVVFTGDVVTVPMLSRVTSLTVGVYAGEYLRTTTPAKIPCMLSVLCEGGKAQEADYHEAAGSLQFRLPPIHNPEDNGKLLQADNGEFVLRTVDELKYGEDIGDRLQDLDKLKNLVIGVVDAINELHEEIEKLDEKIGETVDLSVYQPKVYDTTDTSDETVAGAINKLIDWYDENHYVNMTCEFTATIVGGTYEIGRTVKPIFGWKFSKLPTTLTVGGKSVTPSQEGSTEEQTITKSSEGSNIFSITGVYKGKYGDETVTKAWTYKFQNKCYFGTAEEPTDINSAFIKNLSEQEFATSYENKFCLNDNSKTKYIWYAYPTRFGKANLKMGGFQGGFNEPITILFSNSYGFTENYYVYRSTNPGVGGLNVEVE